MERIEAPEKIYLQENTTTDCYGEFWPEWYEARLRDTDVEYTRTDAFIEKAVAWVKEHKEDVETEDNGIAGWIPDCFIDEFRKYMEGE